MLAPVVVTATDKFAVLAEARFKEEGDPVQVDALGAPAQAKLTLPEKPWAEVAVRL
jgi:hypothetical protein